MSSSFDADEQPNFYGCNTDLNNLDTHGSALHYRDPIAYNQMQQIAAETEMDVPQFLPTALCIGGSAIGKMKTVIMSLFGTS
jgi:hypothetical protein